MLRENFTTDVSVHKEECINFWKSSASISGSRSYFEGSFQHCRLGHFLHNLGHICGKTDRIFVKILSQIYPWTRKSPLNFGSHPDPYWDVSGSDLPWRRYVFSECFCYCYCYNGWFGLPGVTGASVHVVTHHILWLRLEHRLPGSCIRNILCVQVCKIQILTGAEVSTEKFCPEVV